MAVVGGILVSWDGHTRVSVSLPDSFMEKTCGICGNGNGQVADDWTVGDSEFCMEKFPGATPGQVVSLIYFFCFILIIYMHFLHLCIYLIFLTGLRSC